MSSRAKFLSRAPRQPPRGQQPAGPLISVAGLIGQRVHSPDASAVGRITDLIARWQGEPYPPIIGLVAAIAGRRVFVPIANVERLDVDGARLSSGRLNLVDFRRRDGEVLLAGDVMDHQLVDVDGVQVIRASDLFIAPGPVGHCLVGVDVSVNSLLRRLGPRRYRGRPTADRMIDWAVIQPLGAGGAVRVAVPHGDLRRLRPGEIADLLEGLGHVQRSELLDRLTGETAADAVEEMEPADAVALLRQLPPAQAARILTAMEPDEAVDALRDLPDDVREPILLAMDEQTAARLVDLLAFSPKTAGGAMTTMVVTIGEDDTVNDVRALLRSNVDHRLDIDAVLVVDDQGRLVDDITLFELIIAEPGTSMRALIGEPWPVTVEPDAPLDDVVEALQENRRSSVVVVDRNRRPVGRLLADDLLDAIVPIARRWPFTRMPT
jgi:CBS domain-containing protein